MFYLVYTVDIRQQHINSNHLPPIPSSKKIILLLRDIQRSISIVLKCFQFNLKCRSVSGIINSSLTNLHKCLYFPYHVYKRRRLDKTTINYHDHIRGKKKVSDCLSYLYLQDLKLVLSK